MRESSYSNVYPQSAFYGYFKLLVNGGVIQWVFRIILVLLGLGQMYWRSATPRSNIAYLHPIQRTST